jgi:tetratricopeptide (TPR) repeat protein/Mg-chelatase subunit ChlD
VPEDPAVPQFLRLWARDQLGIGLLPARAASFVRVSGRFPGTTRSARGVRLRAHRVTAKIEAGFAHTEVEEELWNDSADVLEGTLWFRAPPGAVITRLALWVDRRLVDAEIVETERARGVYRSIVDWTRRDPALLEQDSKRQVSLRVFPIPPGASRRVVLAYEEPLLADGGTLAYRLGLDLGESAPPLDELSISIAVAGGSLGSGSVHVSGDAAEVRREGGGWRVTRHSRGVGTRELGLALELPGVPDVASFAPVRAAAGSGRFVALRLGAALPSQQAEAQDAVVWVIDRSYSQRGAALADAKAVVAELVGQLNPEQKFAVLACDTACTAFPRHALAGADESSVARAREWILRIEPGGASDIAQALDSALGRVQGTGRAQVVYFGDGQATAGALDLASVSGLRAERSVDLRLVGSGADADTEALVGLGASARGSVLLPRGAQSEVLTRVQRWLGTAFLYSPRLLLPAGLSDPYPEKLPNLVLGDESLVLARVDPKVNLSREFRIELLGDFAGKALRDARTLRLPAFDVRADSAPRLWARGRVRALEADDEASLASIVELSERYQVLSRYTSFLALENDAMFRDFGIEQRRGRAAFGAAPARQSASQRPGVRRHLVRAPIVRSGQTIVSGRVPPEIIQRVVRDHFGRFRACYHAALLKNPRLTGTVATRFAIDRRGAVAGAVSTSTEIEDATLLACIAGRFRELSFPAPDNGVITVVYPLTFSPERDRREPARAFPLPPGRRPSFQFGPPAPPAPPFRLTRLGQEDQPDADGVREDGDRAVRARRLIAAGAFERAGAEAARLAREEPSSWQAFELFAESAAARGAGTEAALSLGRLVELHASDADAELRAARAYASAGDDARACSHFRAATWLVPDDREIRYQALRCRAGTLGERLAVLEELQAVGSDHPKTRRLAEALRTLKPVPPYEPDSEPSLRIRIECGKRDGCPKPILVSAGGLVFSPWTRADFAGGALGLRTLDESEYLVFLTPAPGRPATLIVEGLGARQALDLLGNETGAVARLQVH